MADQAERVILEAEDQVTPITDKANAALDGFEKKAESSHGKVIRISDQTRSSVQRLIASLEKQAETYGKSGVDRLITQRDQLLQRYNREPQAIDAITRSYEKMIAMEEKAAREALAVKAAKEAEEALRKQSEAITSFGDRVSQFMENPLQGAKGAISSVLTTLGPFGIAVTAGAAVLGTIAASAFEAAKSLGEYGTRVKDAELRTGLTAKEVGQFGFAARAVGQDISIVERLMRGLSQAADDNSREGEKARATLRGMGIDSADHSVLNRRPGETEARRHANALRVSTRQVAILGINHAIFGVAGVGNNQPLEVAGKGVCYRQRRRYVSRIGLAHGSVHQNGCIQANGLRRIVQVRLEVSLLPVQVMHRSQVAEAHAVIESEGRGRAPSVLHVSFNGVVHGIRRDLLTCLCIAREDTKQGVGERVARIQREVRIGSEAGRIVDG